jgi:hypothetical protein
MGKNLFGSGRNILDNFSENLETFFGLKILQFLDADPGAGSGIFLTLDPESRMEKFGSGMSGINMPDRQHC